jgi:hypothetical protein
VAFNNVFGFFLTATLVAVMRGGVVFACVSLDGLLKMTSTNTFNEKYIHGSNK